jgi:hypothetical protein
MNSEYTAPRYEQSARISDALRPLGQSGVLMRLGMMRVF